MKAVSNWLEEQFRAVPAANHGELIGRETGYQLDFRRICEEVDGRGMVAKHDYSRLIERDVANIVRGFTRPAFVVLGTPPMLQLAQLQIVFAESRAVRDTNHG